VQAKSAHALAPHPATLQRSATVQPKLASASRAPHPATLPRRGPSPMVAQRADAEAELDLEGLEARITKYGAAQMAGSCVNSAEEVAGVLSRLHRTATVSYIATVYRDGSGEVRNHIAALLRTRRGEQVVDATWKQFPYLAKVRPSELTQLPLVRAFSRQEWEEMIAEHTLGHSQGDVAVASSAMEAKQWMRERRQALQQTEWTQRAERTERGAAHQQAAPQRSRGCALF